MQETADKAEVGVLFFCLFVLFRFVFILVLDR